uniref:Uncharacterized protein n=1 Tax=Ciona savignyi TaxID=51511 RepID=H2ZIW1_CIOSA
MSQQRVWEVQQHKEALGRTTQKLLDKTKECNKIQEKLEKLEKVNKDQEKEISDKNMTDLAWSNRC